MQDEDFGNTLPAPPKPAGPAVEIDTTLNFRFGSPHLAAMQAVFCDGSVRTIRYQVDPELFMRVCNRYDGLETNLSGL